MIRIQLIAKRTNMFVLLFAGLAMAVIIGVLGNNQQAAAAGECGSGYVLKTKAGIYTGMEQTGTLEVYWSSTAKKNCAINRCYGNCGQWLYRDVKIKLSSQSAYANGVRPYSGSDEGAFREFAGPAYTPYSANSCIDVYGGVSRHDGGGWVYDGSRYLNRILCG